MLRGMAVLRFIFYIRVKRGDVRRGVGYMKYMKFIGGRLKGAGESKVGKFLGLDKKQNEETSTSFPWVGTG